MIKPLIIASILEDADLAPKVVESHYSNCTQNPVHPTELSDETEVGGMMWSDLKGLAMMPDYQQHGWFVSNSLSCLSVFSQRKNLHMMKSNSYKA